MSIPESNRKYTYADYLTWPDEERWEIIDGIPCMMTAPSWQHQAIGMQLATQFNNYLAGKPCRVFGAPFDLRLPVNQDDKDEDTVNVVQPDITVICDKSKLKGSGYFGTPKLIIEISSPSTGKMDKVLKFGLYEKAGVSEYWIVEPVDKTVAVFTLQEDGRYGRPQMYSEEDSITVNSFPDLMVDLQQVFEGI
ncbi:MAG TPA: Uma2 family endonuclease [Desulfitobacterium dehalogenans]|uniref:Uma2 family endonuclease n=1 Tax=Desulfitobacterium dehalogenans TaxID=36854 RepID=A0A7C7D572_9FIRM|nr:Uma2 family endonuclease [Desulfitobacterium dehalogenans]